MHPRTLAWIMAGAVLVYLLLLGKEGILLVAVGTPVSIGLGLAILVFPFIGAWVVWRELRFGYQMQAMARSWEDLGGSPDQITFEHARAEAGAHPSDWRVWFELGIAYDTDGDRRRAREAMRHAAGLFPS